MFRTARLTSQCQTQPTHLERVSICDRDYTGAGVVSRYFSANIRAAAFWTALVQKIRPKTIALPVGIGVCDKSAAVDCRDRGQLRPDPRFARTPPSSLAPRPTRARLVSVEDMERKRSPLCRRKSRAECGLQARGRRSRSEPIEVDFLERFHPVDSCRRLRGGKAAQVWRGGSESANW